MRDTLELRPYSPHERLMTCTRCQADVLVMGYVADLDPLSYVGLACGCLLVSKPARELRAVIDQTRAEGKAA